MQPAGSHVGGTDSAQQRQQQSPGPRHGGREEQETLPLSQEEQVRGGGLRQEEPQREGTAAHKVTATYTARRE